MGVGVYRVVTTVVLLIALCRGVPVGLPLPRRGGTHQGNAYHRYDHRPQRDQPRVDSASLPVQPQSQVGPVALPLHPEVDNVFPVQPQGDIVVPVKSMATSYNNMTTNLQTKKGTNNKAVKFMQQFGYIPKPVDGAADFVMSKDYFRKQITKLQKFGDIPQTGELDESTLELMETPRCGLPDLEPEEIEGNHRRRKRYILGSEGWKKRDITYYLANWSGKLRSKEAVQTELRRAFDAWSLYSHLRFREVNETEYQDADIVIFFAEYNHQDGYPFDGPSGILAHAYYPYEFGHYGGDVHFDESEEWTIHPKDEWSGLDFFTVAVHELGHSLGLSHSPVGGSIMFPYYKGYSPNFALDYDDVMAMWDLYIKRKLEGDDEFVRYPTATTTTTTVTPPKEDDESHQADASDDDGNNDENHHDHNSDNDNYNDDSDNENDNNIDNDYANDDDQVRYHGDYETVDEHKRRVGKDKGIGPDLPNLPTLPSDSDSHSAEGDGGGKRRSEDDDFYEEDRKRREEEKEKREEERKREAEEDAERKRWEEEIRRQEEEIRRREKEERRKWEEEERQRDAAWEDSQGRGDKVKTVDTADKKPNVKPKKPPPPIPDICDGNIDAIGVIRQELFIFKGQYLWRYTERNQLRPGYPSLIRNMFKSLPSYLQKVDAVYEQRATGRIVFFIGKYYYIHDGDRIMEGFPKPITDFGLPQVLTELDSAFFWPRAKKLYFFSRNLYWRYNETAEIMDKRYPRDMRNWNGLPIDIQAAFTYTDGNSYFFKGKDYWRYNNQDIAPDNGYPRDVTTDWCGC